VCGCAVCGCKCACGGEHSAYQAPHVAPFDHIDNTSTSISAMAMPRNALNGCASSTCAGVRSDQRHTNNTHRNTETHTHTHTHTHQQHSAVVVKCVWQALSVNTREWFGGFNDGARHLSCVLGHELWLRTCGDLPKPLRADDGRHGPRCEGHKKRSHSNLICSNARTPLKDTELEQDSVDINIICYQQCGGGLLSWMCGGCGLVLLF
jgi:hypothetical protein